jgi:hypothetical protein
MAQSNSDSANIMDTPLFNNLRKLINVVDELRDVGL